jgi:prepilin-type N-terminal cleavage/methylation domain-containing protein/prepilin-type processing-associated H-X9-DG protein
MRKECKYGNGFTLVELLVVIALLAILAALLFPVLSDAKARSRRTTCLCNLRQINLGVRMYSDEANDKTPLATNGATVVFAGYKELMKHYLGLRGTAAAQDRVFSCPADVFYYDAPFQGHTLLCFPESICAQPWTDYSSYAFNSANLLHVTNRYSGQFIRPGIAGQTLSSIRHPARTVMVTEFPAIIPFSWHHPKRPFSAENSRFNNAMNMVSFVDGHVSYIKIFWKTAWPIQSAAMDYDPPAGYDYQWSGD